MRHMESKVQRRQRKNEPDFELIGPFKAEVVENEDPDKEGKITVKIPELYGTSDLVKLVEPKYPMYQQNLPQIGMFTWVTFRHLQREMPMWEGAWYPSDDNLPDWQAKPTQHLHQILDKSRKKLFTIFEADEEGKTLTIRDHIKGNVIELDGNTGNINIFSDKGPEGSDTGSINLNGEPVISTFPAARQFDETVHICPLIGLTVKGMIMQGSKRVLISNDKPM